MVFPSNIYVTNNSVSSYLICPLILMKIVAPFSGTTLNYTSNDGLTQITIKSTLLSTNLELHIPDTTVLTHLFTFRVKSYAEGGAVSKISFEIEKINCNYGVDLSQINIIPSDTTQMFIKE